MSDKDKLLVHLVTELKAIDQEIATKLDELRRLMAPKRRPNYHV